MLQGVGKRRLSLWNITHLPLPRCTRRAEPPFVFFLIEEEKRRGSAESCQPFEVVAARTSGLVSLVSLVELFECKHQFIDKLIIITERTAIKPGVETISQ